MRKNADWPLKTFCVAETSLVISNINLMIGVLSPYHKSPGQKERNSRETTQWLRNRQENVGKPATPLHGTKDSRMEV